MRNASERCDKPNLKVEQNTLNDKGENSNLCKKRRKDIGADTRLCIMALVVGIRVTSRRVGQIVRLRVHDLTLGIFLRLRRQRFHLAGVR